MKLLQYEDIPRWYSLFWDFKNSKLCLKIHKAFLENEEFKDYSPYFQNIEQKFDWSPLFDTWEPLLGKRTFGINDSITLVNEDDAWLTYQIKIPQAFKKTCSICSGTGKPYGDDASYRDNCRECNGSKKEIRILFDEIHRTCFSLSILLTALAFSPDIEIKTDSKQLFTITTICQSGPHGHSAGGVASPTLLSFLNVFSKEDYLQVKVKVFEAMNFVHEALFGRPDSSDSRFFVDGKHFALSCLGDACEIHTDPIGGTEDMEGADITCHNLDAGIQQLTLLSGLAVLTTLCDTSNSV